MKKTDPKKLEEFIRVDHAGERGAIKIYEGQLLALSTIVKNNDLKEMIRDMKEHEQEHCNFFEDEIRKRNIKPTKLLPLWDLLGLGLGFGSTILGRKDNSLAPFAINGGDLNGITYTMPVASAQVKSCLLIAGLSANTSTTLIQPAVSRDHTELMLTAMGGQISTKGLELTIQPSKLQSIDVAVPGDISSAAFWMIAALCHPDAELTIQNIGINPSRTGILTALQMMGASDSLKLVSPRIEGGEQVADIEVSSSRLEGAELSGDLIPLLIDEIPILAIAACFAEGTTTIKDAAELRVKESDRIATTVEMVRRLGGKIEPTSDGMIIEGTGNLKGAECNSHHDHRLAMSSAIAGLLSSGETKIINPESASISYPSFWAQAHRLMNGNS